MIQKSQKYGMVQKEKCEARKTLKSEALVANIGVDTAEKGRRKVSEKWGPSKGPHW